MITYSIYGKAELLQRITDWTPSTRAALRHAITEQAIKLQAHVITNKLTGQVLHVRTGTLRRSINMRVDEDGSKIVGAVGTNVRYGAFWEFGFSGVETVRAHLRRVADGSRYVPVREHDRHVDVQARSFLRSALADRANDIRDALKFAVRGNLK